jgi:DNA-binding cell septation regulator SpoVG
MSLVSDVQIWPVDGQGKVKARGNFMVANAFKVQYSLMQGPKGLFVGLPSRKGKDKEGNEKWYNDVFCTDEAVFKEMNTAVLAAYKSKTGTSQGEAQGPSDQSRSDGIPF